MMPRTLLTTVLTLAVIAAGIGLTPADETKKADEPKKVEEGTLIVIDGAGKEHKLKSWKFTSGIRHLTWLAPALPPEKEPAEKDPKTAPRKSTLAGPEAFVMREENSTGWANGVTTLVPLDRLRAIDFNAEKESMSVQVATSAKPEEDVTLNGSTEFQGINKLGIDAEVDKGDLGVAEIRFLGGIAKGIRGVRFPSPKAPAEIKDARLAAVSYGDRKSNYVVNVSDLKALYRTADGEVLSPLLFFKKTVKIDLSKIKKIAPNKEEGTKNEPVWQVTLKTGDEETLTLLTRVELDGKPAQLEALIARVPAGYKLFPIDNAQLLHEIEFDVKKDEGEVKPKPDTDK